MKRQLAGIPIILAMIAGITGCNINAISNGATTVPQISKSTLAVQSTEPPTTQPLPSLTATQSPVPTSTQVLPSPTPTLGIGSQKQSTIDGMIQVFVPAGEFTMGSDAYDAIMSAPVYLDAFWMDQTEVTNAMFAKFITATHYRTDAEKKWLWVCLSFLLRG